MELKIKSMPIGWSWMLTTDEGFVFEHVSLEFKTIFERARDLNARVIDSSAVRVEEEIRR